MAKAASEWSRSRRDLPSGVRLDRGGRLRILARGVRFEDAAESALGPIRHYGSDAPLVASRMLLVLARLSPQVSREDDRRVLRRHAERCIEAARENIASPRELAEVEERYRQTARALAEGAST